MKVTTTDTEPSNILEQFLLAATAWIEEIFGNLGFHLFRILQIVLIFVFCNFAMSLISRVTKFLMDRPSKHAEAHRKRIRSIMTLARSVMRYLIYFTGLAMILNVLGFGTIVTNLVITASVGSLAIAFGAQSLLKDVLTGILMVFENQYSVGDYVKLDDNEGTVEAIAMRVTYLRTFDGLQVIIPNGTITKVTNYSRGSCVAKITIPTRYEENTERVVAILHEVVDEYEKDNRHLLAGKPDVFAIAAFNASSVDVVVRCKTAQLKHWQVERELRLAIKARFDEVGISIPYQTLTIKGVNSPEEKKKESVVPLRKVQ
ncbi:MAG: mechanosensitive ion channel family protein [Erysipelotrichaceae bacterium]|jgi:small conductance mechanosensitive channel|nr:mechanosensitive ion channel family protein [Erysipelotrichaceae bacterium]